MTQWLKELLGFRGIDPDNNWVVWMLFGLCCLLVVIILFGIYSSIYSWLDEKHGSWIYKYGKVVDRHYVGETSSSSTTTTLVPTTSGGMGIGTSSSTHTSPEQFLLFIDDEQKDTYKIPVDMQKFYDLSIGDKVKFGILTGKYSGDQLKIQVEDQ